MPRSFFCSYLLLPQSTFLVGLNKDTSCIPHGGLASIREKGLPQPAEGAHQVPSY